CSCLQSFTPNTKCLLSDVLSMLTGFLPHGDVGRYYLFLRSRYRQFQEVGEQLDSSPIQRLVTMTIGSGNSPRCRKGDTNQRTTNTLTIKDDQHLSTPRGTAKSGMIAHPLPRNFDYRKVPKAESPPL